MDRFLRSKVAMFAAAAVVITLGQRADALGPSALMFYGGTLAAPVYVTGAEANLFGDLLTPSNVAVKDIEGRPYLKVAVFWGTQSNPSGRGVPLAQLKPDMAWQHGKYYPATGSKPAVLIVTTLHRKVAQDLPDFRNDAAFLWGGALSPAATTAVMNATHASKPPR